MTVVALIIASYLWGAIPTGYLVARYRKGIDIRKYGSGNVGATNLMASVGKWTGLLVGAFDCLGKGTLVVVAARLLDQGLAVQVAAGLAAIAGHNWSPFVGFTGGRGVATAIGVVFGFALWYEAIIVAVLLGAIGRLLLKETGFWTFISLLALPVLAAVFDRSVEIVALTLGIGGLLLAKRLTANWESPPPEYPLGKVLLYRLIWDRDVRTKEEWVRRRPLPENEISPSQ